MKKKVITIVGIIAVIIIAAILIVPRILGGTHVGIDNDPEAEVKGESNILVAYFSWSGNLQQMARWTAEETGGDLFRIVPAKSYGKDYGACADRAKNELDNGTRPELSAHIEAGAMAKYDTIYLGYPIWWGEAPHIMYTLVEKVSMKKKTVVPFCTSMSSGMGSSAKHLKKNAVISKRTKWLKGRNFYDRSTQKKVNRWIKSLKY